MQRTRRPRRGEGTSNSVARLVPWLTPAKNRRANHTFSRRQRARVSRILYQACDQLFYAENVPVRIAAYSAIPLPEMPWTRSKVSCSVTSRARRHITTTSTCDGAERVSRLPWPSNYVYYPEPAIFEMLCSMTAGCLRWAIGESRAQAC